MSKSKSAYSIPGKKGKECLENKNYFYELNREFSVKYDEGLNR